MAWKPKLLFCGALTILSVALISQRASSIGLVDLAESPAPSIESFDDDLDVSLEEEPSPHLHRLAQPHQSVDAQLTAFSDSESDIDDYLPFKDEDVDYVDLPFKNTLDEDYLPFKSAPSKSQPPCFPDEVLLVSTMDGKISALDLDHLEQPIWSVATGSSLSASPEPLLSTSNVKIEAGASWVIPSLDGMLHKFDMTSDEDGDHLRSTVRNGKVLLESRSPEEVKQIEKISGLFLVEIYLNRAFYRTRLYRIAA